MYLDLFEPGGKWYGGITQGWGYNPVSTVLVHLYEHLTGDSNGISFIRYAER
jgi:hypothetical protein